MILLGEKPHVVAYYSDGKKEGEADIPETEGRKKLSFYTVFNIAQCKWPEGTVFGDVTGELDPIQKCVQYKVKDPKRSYYDPLLDFVNLAAEKNFASKEQYCYQEFHQLMHSTGQGMLLTDEFL